MVTPSKNLESRIFGVISQELQNEEGFSGAVVSEGKLAMPIFFPLAYFPQEHVTI